MGTVASHIKEARKGFPFFISLICACVSNEILERGSSVRGGGGGGREYSL